MLVSTLEYANINGWKGCFSLLAFIYTLPLPILGSIKNSIDTTQGHDPERYEPAGCSPNG